MKTVSVRRSGDASSDNSVPYFRTALALLILALSASCTVSPTPGRVQEQVTTRGADDVVRELYAQPERWASVLNHIETGDPEWIAAALVLRPGSDAGSTSMLNDSMFAALEKAPEIVITYAFPTFDLASVCGGRIDPLPTYEQGVRELEVTLAAVSRIQDPVLESRKRACLAQLEESRSHLKRFFHR